jgi:polar amino acid transport system ATP-binding protein
VVTHAPGWPEVRKTFFDWDQAAGGMTMMIATHEMSFARDIANRVCFLDEGVILEQGPPEQILSEPSEPRTQQFLQRIIAASRM